MNALMIPPAKRKPASCENDLFTSGLLLIDCSLCNLRSATAASFRRPRIYGCTRILATATEILVRDGLPDCQVSTLEARGRGAYFDTQAADVPCTVLRFFQIAA